MKPIDVRKRSGIKLHGLKLGLISSFPPTKCGVSNYSAKLIEALGEYIDLRNVFVFVDIIDHQLDTGNSVNIARVWKWGSLRCFLSIFRHVMSKGVNIAHIQHEYLLYGRPYYSGLFPLLPLMLRFSGKKVVVTMHSIVPRFSLKQSFFKKYGAGLGLVSLKRLLTIAVTKLIGVFSSRVIVHNEAAREVLIEDYGFAPGKILVIPHGVDLHGLEFNSKDAKRRLGLDTVNVLLFFGFIHPRKGIENAIKALSKVQKEYPNTKLIVAGGCHRGFGSTGREYIKDLERLAKRLGLKHSVLFTKSFIPDNDIPLYFAAADICVLPYTEDGIIGASGALLTAAGYGRPVVAGNVSRFSDVVDQENALVVPHGDPDALAEAVLALLSDLSLQKRISEGLRRLARRNSWENVSKKTLALYLDLLDVMYVEPIRSSD
jgi:glycosyltransferase involved in cell wall biosynthesis